MALVPSLQAGSQFGEFRFSHDSKYLFCCCGSVVKVFNTVNGECVHDLKGHSQKVTGISVNPSNILQILSCGKDGQLIYWDYLDGVRLKHYNLHMPLNGIVSVSAEKKSIMMLAQTSDHKTTSSLMQWKRSKTNSSEFAKPKVLLENCDDNQQLLSFGCMREFVASGLNQELTIYSMKKETSRRMSDKDRFTKQKNITCVCCHPTEYCIATGLENGKIILWRNFFKDTQPVTSTMHWHALPVMCLNFTPDGANLLSGGHECVLVRWQVGNPSQRDFKPRMGAPLSDVLSSPDGNFYATRHSDNVIQLMNINLKILQAYRGLTRNCFDKTDDRNPIPSGLKFDPRSRALITNGLPGHLQFYSLTLNKQLFNLDIVGQNYISPENIDRPKVITEVTCSAVSDDGQWLATFEMWDDGSFTPEYRLKFWMYTNVSQTYLLNTTVEQPHDKPITNMLFRPWPVAQPPNNTPALVTIGEDCCYKMWTLIDDTNIYRSNTRWNCDSVGYYRGMRASCADFSRDASTLAVAFEHLLTVWDPDNNAVRTALSNALSVKEEIMNVKFGSHHCCHQLVMSTTGNLIAWDLLTLTIQWSIKVQVSVLIRDPSSDLMAYLSTNRSLCVFRPNSSNMIYQHEKLTSHDIVDAVFVPNGRHEDVADIGWPGQSQIYVYDKEQQLISLDLPSQQKNEGTKVRVAQSLPKTAFSTMMAEKLVRENNDAEMKDTMGHTEAIDETFVSMLLHSNEPVSLHCEKYLSSLLVKKKQKSKSHHHNNMSAMSDSDEESSSSESEMETNEAEQQQDIKTKATFGKKKSSVSSTKKEENMDKLLSKPLDWMQWCASLSLK